MTTIKCLICGSKRILLHKNLFDDRYGSPGYYDVYFCTKCGFGRTDPALEKSNIGKFYKNYYPLSKLSASNVQKLVFANGRFRTWLTGTNNIAHRFISAKSDVLDVGSGSGVSLLEIRQLGGDAWGVEPDPNAQKIAKKLKLKVFRGFITDNPFPKKKFDFVTASQVIEHEPDPLEFLIAAKNKLKPNGKIILSFPNFNSIFRKIFRRKWINWHIPYHINFFTQDSINRLAKNAGLKIVNEKTVTPNIWTVLQIRNMFSQVKMGRKNPLWSGKKNNNLVKLVNLVLFIAVTSLNRFFDLLGMGDSILVILKNEK